MLIDPGGGESVAEGVSADGSVVVGQAISASGPEAFRWTELGGIVGLGDLPGRKLQEQGIRPSAVTALSSLGPATIAPQPDVRFRSIPLGCGGGHGRSWIVGGRSQHCLRGFRRRQHESWAAAVSRSSGTRLRECAS